MELTKELIKIRFDEYNRLYFNGKLGKCTFGFITSYNEGVGEFSSKQDDKGKKYGCIRMSKLVAWNEETLREVLLHEMIHMYNQTVELGLASIWPFNGLFFHGFFFKRQCRRIKMEYGIEVFSTIPITEKFSYKNKKRDSFASRVVSKMFGC